MENMRYKNLWERGDVLVTLIGILLLLTILVFALFALSQADMRAVGLQRDTRLAFEAAEAGIAYGMNRIPYRPRAIKMRDTFNIILQNRLSAFQEFRSGIRGDMDSTNDFPRFVSRYTPEGFSIGGKQTFVYEIYDIPTTGIGPRNAERRIFARARVGPVGIDE